MPVPSSMADLSTAASSNYPRGPDAIGTLMDDYMRAMQAILKQGVSVGADIASLTTITIPSAGHVFTVTGTNTIAGIADAWVGRAAFLRFADALQLTHNATTFALPGGANITTAAGDWAIVVQVGTGQWRVAYYGDASGYLPLDGGEVTGTTEFSGTLNVTGSVQADGTDVTARLRDGLTLKGYTTYTSGSGTYTTPAGVRAIYVELIGGGGGAGGADGDGSANVAISAGGGGGGYCAKMITSPAASYSYAVGAGGAGAAGAVDGSDGGDSTFTGSGVSMVAGGGAGSVGSASAAWNSSQSKTQRASSGGEINLLGSPSEYVASTSGALNGYPNSGRGTGPLGGAAVKCAQNANGDPGQPYGGGGGGCYATQFNTNAYTGGSGASGIVRITEYY